MKQKLAVKRSVDVLMTLSLLFLMGYQFWGDTAHEWVGAGMFVLFIAHHLLNLNWHKRLFKGRYTPARIAMLCIDLLVLLAMLALMYSGIVLSRHVFAVLPIQSGLALARRLHILGAYWGYILMSLHLGLHWNMILTMAAKLLHLVPLRPRKEAAFLLSALIAAYGVSVFIRRDFLTYMFLRTEFVFLDFSESKLLFYLDYLALLDLCIFLAHYGGKMLKMMKKKKLNGGTV